MTVDKEKHDTKKDIDDSYEDAEKTEANKYMIRVDQFLMYP